MKRSFLPVAAALGVLALAPAAASARTSEVGQTATPVQAPVCPTGVSKQNCTIILTETTALETASDAVLYPTTIKSNGRIVAYTLGLAKLAKKDITTLDAAYGGNPYVQLVVLRKAAGDPGKHRFFTVVQQSKPNNIQPWFGHVTTWPLTQTLPVHKGDLLGLTVPTWAPVLAINLPTQAFQYRASRTAAATQLATYCGLATTFSTQTAQMTIGDTKQYGCHYTATRAEYTATEITSPPIPKDAVK